MCCTTHDERDRLDRADGINVDALLTRDERFRCQCKFGHPCHRAMTAEDLVCDWCRGTNHETACKQMQLPSDITYSPPGQTLRARPGWRPQNPRLL
jgi:hypothetical protein